MCATILYHNKLQQMCLTKGSSMTELQELRRYRRDLHRIPELDFDLPQTIAYIEGVLAPLTCEVTHPCPNCVLPPRRMSTVRFANSRAPLGATFSLCSSRPRKRPVVPRRYARVVCSSAMGPTAFLASMCGPICLPARWRVVPVRCWRVRARRISIFTVRASTSLRPMVCRLGSRTMPRWRQRSFWLPSAS